MSTTIHLARFGNHGGAHTLLTHTGADADLLGKIVWRTDAPPNSPEVIEPFPSGYRLDESYIVQITRPDDTAARPGMVATTAAIIPIPLLAGLDLRTLLAQLVETRAELGPPLVAPPPPPTGPHEHPPGAGALASALLARGRAAWIGSGLADAIGCVWNHISPADRAHVVFSAAFHPEGLSVPTGSGSIVALAIPGRVAARWSDWPTVGIDSATPEDSARDALFGDDDGRAAALSRELGTVNAPFARWRHLATAAELLARVGELDHESTRALLQLLGLLQPIPGKGQGPKRAALARLAELTPAAAFTDLRGLRGVPWQSLPRAPDLAELLNDWAHTTVSDGLRAGDFTDAAAAIVVSDPTDAFHQALATALRDAVDGLSLPQAAEAVLRHPLGADATTWLVRHAGSRSALDAALADAAPAAGAVPGWVLAAADLHRLPRTHAVAVDVSDPVAAWRAHLQIAPRTEAADDVLARRTSDAGTVRAGLRIADAKLADRAGQLVAARPDLLIAGDVSDEKFQAVWAAAIRHGADPWRTVSPADAAVPLLALVVDDHPVDAALLDALSRTSAADVAPHAYRALLWDRLPPEVATRFKAATAATIARTLRPGDPAPEPQLAAAILAPDVLGAVAHEDAGQAVVVLRGLPAARAEHAGLVARRGSFAHGDAVELARLVVDRRWRRAAETIADLAHSKPELQVAVGPVAQLFSPLERLRRLIGFSDGVRGPATGDEPRDTLHEIASHLYPEGPTEGALWERAGGNDADLPEASTGRSRWGLALDAVIRGQRGAPDEHALLELMMADYPKNPDLRAFAKRFPEWKKE